MKNLSNEQLLKEMPFCDIGQITKKQRDFLNRQAKKGIVKKIKWYWNNISIGNKKTWYYPA